MENFKYQETDNENVYNSRRVGTFSEEEIPSMRQNKLERQESPMERINKSTND